MQTQQNDPAIAAQIVPLLPAIYEAATNPSRWPDAFARIVHLLGGNSGLIFSHTATPEQHGMWVPYRCTEEGLRRYSEHYYAFDIWMQRGHQLGVLLPGNVVTGDDLLPRKEFLASVFYREHLALDDIHDVCSGILHDGSEPDMPIVHVAIYRSHAMPLFGETEKALLAALTSHLREATRTGFRIAALERRVGVMQSAVETISPALVLLDAQGRVVFVNSTAQAILAANNGLEIVAGKLAAKGEQQSRLNALLMVSPAEEKMLKITHSSGRSCVWLIRVPMLLEGNAPPDARRPAIALMIHDPAELDTLDFKGFAKVHGLTPAEARITNLLLEHMSLPPISQELGVSINTVRSQLRSILEKTGARRQAELVRMLSSWPRRMG